MAIYVYPKANLICPYGSVQNTRKFQYNSHTSVYLSTDINSLLLFVHTKPKENYWINYLHQLQIFHHTSVDNSCGELVVVTLLRSIVTFGIPGLTLPLASLK